MKKSLIALLVMSMSVNASTYYINVAENLKEYYVVDTNKVWNPSDSTFTEWMNVDSPFNLSLYLPEISTQTEDFNQIQTFSQNQNQFEQKKVYEKNLNIYQNVGDPIEHLQTILDNNSREVTVIAEDWVLIDGLVNCQEWSPLSSTILFNEEFSQSRQCEQERSTNLSYYINDNLETTLPFSEINLMVENQQSFGTNADTGWLLTDPSFSDWIDFEVGYDYLEWSPEISLQLVDFIQNRDYSQNQTQMEQPREQNTFTLEYRDFGEPTEIAQTVISNEERNITVELGDWMNEGIYFDCLDFLPLPDTIAFGEEFTQNADCQQEQVTTRVFKNEEDILVTDNATQTITNNVEVTEIGTNSDGGWVLTTSLVGNWINEGIAYDKAVWTPTLSNQTANLTQSQDYSQDQIQTEQSREQNTFTFEYRNIGEEFLNNQTIIESENRSITVTNLDWVNSGSSTNCGGWTPESSTKSEGLSFQQTRSCTQLQLKTYNQKHNEDILNTFVLNQDISISENQTIFGTKALGSCLDILNGGSSNGSGNYNIKLNGLTKNVYCDMTTDGGGWTIVADQNLYKEGYPTANAGIPDDNPNNIKNTRLTVWPKYTEYSIKTVIDLHGATYDASVAPAFNKFSTGSFGEVDVDMMSFYLNKTNYQNGKASNNYVMYNGVAWGDSHPHASYYGYRWFNQNNVVYNWWGQADVWGHLINTNLFRIASTEEGYARTGSCGTAWANNACRLAMSAWINRSIIKQKVVFMVR